MLLYQKQAAICMSRCGTARISRQAGQRNTPPARFGRSYHRKLVFCRHGRLRGAGVLRLLPRRCRSPASALGLLGSCGRADVLAGSQYFQALRVRGGPGQPMPKPQNRAALMGVMASNP